MQPGQTLTFGRANCDCLHENKCHVERKKRNKGGKKRGQLKFRGCSVSLFCPCFDFATRGKKVEIPPRFRFPFWNFVPRKIAPETYQFIKLISGQHSQTNKQGAPTIHCYGLEHIAFPFPRFLPLLSAYLRPDKGMPI